VKVKKATEGSDIRRVLGSMVADPVVCARVSSHWDVGGLFSGSCENRLASWCVQHFRSYDNPIGADLESRFDEWAVTRNGDGEVQLMEKLIRHVMSDYEKLGDGGSQEYVLDIAGRLFNQVRMEKLIRQVEADLDRRHVVDAHDKLARYSRLELGTGSIIRPGSDFECWQDSFDHSDNNVLIRYPGALGQFVEDELSRDSFVAFLGTAKVGKTWWLIDLAYRAVRRRKRVVYCEAGDLSKRQILRRLGQRCLRRPTRGGVYVRPVSFGTRDDLVTEEVSYQAITAQDCFHGWRKVTAGKDRFRLLCFPNSSLTVDMISSQLSDWAGEGWAPDVVVIDYADILAPPVGVMDKRDQINENWKHLRRITQEYHCLVATATQADSKAMKSDLLRRENFADDRRKYDHVTAMWGLNTSEKDKDRGTIRVNYLVRREGEFVETRVVHVAACLGLGMPIVRSVF